MDSSLEYQYLTKYFGSRKQANSDLGRIFIGYKKHPCSFCRHKYRQTAAAQGAYCLKPEPIRKGAVAEHRLAPYINHGIRIGVDKSTEKNKLSMKSGYRPHRPPPDCRG